MKTLLPTIREIKDAGYSVRAGHKRFYKVDGEAVYKGKIVLITNPEDGFLIQAPLLFRYEAEKQGIEKAVHPRGGMTLIEITTPSQETIYAEVYCHPRDNYSKKEGLKRVIGKAISKMKDNDKARLGILS